MSQTRFLPDRVQGILVNVVSFVAGWIPRRVRARVLQPSRDGQSQRQVLETFPVLCPFLLTESRCGLVVKLTGLEAAEYTKTSDPACRECQSYAPPTTEKINPVIASHLFHATSKLIEKGGEEFCSTEKAEELRLRAFKHLKISSEGQSEANSRKGKIGSYKGPCSYLGDQTGDRNCTSCRGHVKLKEFECLHDAHTTTVIRECSCCADYEPRLKKATIENWAVGITTAPRRKPNLGEMLQSLFKAGWETPTVFAEPESDLSQVPSSIEVCQRTRTLGAWPNFLLALTELVLREPHADAYFMCQDDAVFCLGLRDYLEQELWPDKRVGVVSLHTPSHQAHENRVGFFPKDVGWGAWGAMAFIFPNSSARAFLRDPAVINHRNRGMGEGLKNVDSVVGNWCRSTQIPFYLHSPSLCEHIGETTTLWSKDSLEGKRSSADFPGQEANINELMNRQQPRPISSHSPIKSPANLNHRRSSNIAVVLRQLDHELIAGVEAQELKPHEKYLILDSAENTPDGWSIIADETRLAESSCEWLVFLEPGLDLPGSFISDLNEQLSEAPISPDFQAGPPTIIRRDAFSLLIASSAKKQERGALKTWMDGDFQTTH